jgi:hypothetical protein
MAEFENAVVEDDKIRSISSTDSDTSAGSRSKVYVDTGSDSDDGKVASGVADALEHEQHPPPNGTLIIFDWDDTLCPSYFLEKSCGLSLGGELVPPDDDVAEDLEDFASELGALLQLAKQQANRVVIVTNAAEGWVQDSCTAWMPQLRGHMENVEISSARSNWTLDREGSPTSWKAREFGNIIDQLNSWENVIVVGDADYEHRAFRRIQASVPRGQSAKCKAKSVKLSLRPSIQELSLEIQALRNHLSFIIGSDEDLNLEVSSKGVFMMHSPISSPISSPFSSYCEHGGEVPEFHLTIEE